MLKLDDRFWSKVDREAPGGCWLWKASKNNKGYGMFCVRSWGYQHKQLAHRLCYADQVCPIPKGALLLHSCDNPSCVNPAHLRVGSHRENVADMDQRGRRISNTPKGAENCNAILTDGQVIALRKDYISGATHAELAKRYGISVRSVPDYTGSRSWRHLLGVDGAPTEADLLAAKNRTPNAKITAEIAREIKALLSAGETGISVAARYGIHKATVSDIRRGKIWRDA